MSTYYQTTAKPRGRRQTGPSNSSTSSRAPSESSKLTKKISRSSDESTPAPSTNSRTHSPMTFMQRQRTLDRSSLLESILPKSLSSHSFKFTEANATSESDVRPNIRSSKSHASTPASPILTASKSDSRPDHQSLHSKASSKSMTDAINLDIKQSVVEPIARRSSKPDAHRRSSSETQNGRTSHYSTKLVASQPSVADATEDNTPTPTPAVEHEQMPFISVKAPESEQDARSSTHEEVSPMKHGNAPLQPLQQPAQTWYTDSVPQRWHQTASPPQSPVIHQYGGFQTPGQAQYPYDFSYAYPPHIAPSSYQQYTNPYYSTPFSPPTEAAPIPTAERHISGSGSGEEQSELMSRIQRVLPDLARLLEQSREDQAPPAAADGTVTQSQPDLNEQLIGLQQELDATKKEYERVIRNLVDENCTLKSEAKDRQQRSRSLEGDSRGSRKLKTEFKALQAQHQDLASSVDSIRLSKEELISEKLGVEKHIELLKKDRHIIKDSHHRAISDLKQQHMQELATRDREHQRIATEHKSALSKVQLDLASLISRHASAKKDLEIARSSEAAYKASAEARLKELDVARLHHFQQSDKLKAEHQRNLESLKQEHKSQRQRRENEARRYVIELEAFRSREREWVSKSQSLQAELQEHKTALATEKDAHASLKKLHEERNRRTADLAGSMTLWRQKHAELQKENENLDRVLHALGFGSTDAEIEPELQQTRPDAEPMPMLNDKQTASAEGLHFTKNATEVKQEVDTESAATAITPKQELAPEKEQSREAEIKSTVGPATAIEPPETAETAITPEVATALHTMKASLSIDNRNISMDNMATQATEKAPKVSDKPEQAAADLIMFRPIHYYQIPGQYH